ncbi:MAG: hypothetical protein CSA38_04100 [Flavobacteriales bacterium]|nr:MAG: hypothetical protein CSA38_04100 [Flavobacteriales bacterium]
MRSSLLYFLFIIFSLFLKGQVSVFPVVSKERLYLNKPFHLTFVVKIKGQLDTESPLYLPDLSKFQVVGSASNYQTVVKGNEVEHQKVYQWVLKPLKKGKLKIGVAKIKVNGQFYSTEPIDIFVNDVSPSTNSYLKQKDSPMTMDVLLDNSEVYENQPVYGSVKIYATNPNELRQIKKISFPPQENIAIQQVTYRKSNVQMMDNRLFVQEVAQFVSIPTQSGELEIPSIATKAFKGQKLVSKPVKLKVKPLPKNPPKGFLDAVGEDFTINISSDVRGKMLVSKPINLKIKIKGKGNLTKMKLPKIKVANAEVFPPKIQRNISENPKNRRGEVIAQYVIVPKKSGNLKISTEDFAYFNTHHERYMKVPISPLVLSVEAKKEKTIFHDTSDYSPPTFRYQDQQKPVKNTEKIFDGKLILLNILALIILLIAFFGFRKWQKNNIKNKNNSLGNTLGSVEESEEEIKENFENNIQDDLFFLKKMKDEKKYEAFFKEINELEDKCKNKLQISDLQQFINESLGAEQVEKYQKLQEKIQWEKYAPLKNAKQIDEIYHAIVKLYLEISK